MRFDLQLGYSHPDQGDDPRPDPYKDAAIAVAKWAGEFLHRHYPGHAWHVEANVTATGGHVKIRLNGIMPPQAWYFLRLSEMQTDPSGRRIMRAAGELLERYNLHRGAFGLDDWRAALTSMPLVARATGRGHMAPLR